MAESPSKKLEYDSTLGGPIVLDTHVPTFRYAAASATELQQLLAEVQCPAPGANKMIFQTLPKHMRRRAMSHHAKRLPRKYRHVHTSQMEKTGSTAVGKRPSRKHRRRPSLLLAEYTRRQRRVAWMETHIWHARRFHMVDKWGYRLPYASCDKTFRACYRASAEHCLVQDISFYGCVQLTGSLEQLASGLQRLNRLDCCEPIITARTYVQGRREGSTVVFRDGQYPYGCLGRVRFMWRPLQGDAAERSLWMWVHPCMYTAFLEELIKVFDLVSTKHDKVEPPPAESAPADAKKFKANRRYRSTGHNVELLELRGKLNRFRLTGPLSHAVLQNALRCPTRSAAQTWFGDRHQSEDHQLQANYWRQMATLASCAELPSNMVIALNADDPRIHRPAKRTKAFTPTHEFDGSDLPLTAELPPTALADSALWEPATRQRVQHEMISTREYCRLRERHATVPGGRCTFEWDMQPVPLILIQRPGCQDSGSQRLGYGAGWDVIVPAGYGMVVWLSLIMWGARPAGLQQAENIAQEMATDEFDADSVGGLQRAAEKHLELKGRYFRLPPNKRCNYRKLSIASPFRAPFRELLRDWLSSALESAATPPKTMARFYVLRSRALLQALDECLTRRCEWPDQLPDDCLVPVQLTLVQRGNISEHSLICLPIGQDLCRAFKAMANPKRDSYVEPLVADANEQERKQLREQHRKLLKRLRSRRVREKRKAQETSSRRVHIRAAGTARLVADHFDKMCRLWLAEDFSTLFSVRKQCSRDVIGYVTSAGYAYTGAKVRGFGYVTANGLREWHRNACRTQEHCRKAPYVLVRDPQSRHYHVAQIGVHCERGAALVQRTPSTPFASELENTFQS